MNNDDVVANNVTNDNTNMRNNFAHISGFHTSSRCTTITVGLPKRCFARMTPEMIVQMLLAGECFQADTACKRFVRRMAFHVPLQAGFVSEHMIANIACEHVVAVVSFPVCRQLLGRWKSLAAHLAHERLSLVMVASMHDQLVFVGKHFATHIASMRRGDQRQTGHIRAVGRVQLLDMVGGILEFGCDHAAR